MKSISVKYINRFKLVIGGSVFNLVTPFGNLLISVLFIRLTSQTFYGTIASLLILFDLAFNVISWGNKEFLLREFSKSPAQSNMLWSESILNRIPLLILFLLLIPFFAESFREGIFFLIWIVSRYVQRSYDVHIQFNKVFSWAAVIEMIGFSIVIAPVLFFKNSISRNQVIFSFAVSAAVKMMLTFFLFRKKAAWSFNVPFSPFNYLVGLVPFLLLTLSGLFQSKADVYGVALYMLPSELAQYQVLSGFLGFALMIAHLLLFPFAKNMYRINKATMRKLKQKLFLNGILISAAAMFFIYVVMILIYRIEFPFVLYVLCFLYLIPAYLYVTYFYEYTKHNFQKHTVLFTMISGSVNFILCRYLIGVFGREGAMAAAVTSQWLLYFLFVTKKIPIKTK